MFPFSGEGEEDTYSVGSLRKSYFNLFLRDSIVSGEKVAFWDPWGILWSHDISISIATGYEIDV
jgi:hypothetical protein